jgi:hypothetical protein
VPRALFKEEEEEEEEEDGALFSTQCTGFLKKPVKVGRIYVAFGLL